MAFVKELKNIGKLDDWSSPGIFIGNTEGDKAYRVLDSVTRRVRVTRDVVCDEGRGWAWDKEADDGLASALRDFTIKYAWTGGAGGTLGGSP